MNLTDGIRHRYTVAIMELATTLSVSDYTFVNITDFCQRHAVPPSFFNALRDLDALQFDVVNESGYQRTPVLSMLTPERVIEQMQGLVGYTPPPIQQLAERPKQSNAKNKPVKPRKARTPRFVFHAPEPAKACTDSPVLITSDAVQEQMQELREVAKPRPQAQPKPYPTPEQLGYVQLPPPRPFVGYTIDIEAPTLSVRMNVRSADDVEILDAILTRLNRHEQA